MKKILLVSGLAFGVCAFGQSTFNKLSIDFDWGVNKALTGPLMGKAVKKQFSHFDLGARYMFNNKWGLYGGVVFESYKTTLSTFDYKTNSVGVNLQGIYNLRNSLDFDQFSKKFGSYIHAGPGIVFNMGSSTDASKTYKTEKLASWTTGLALQYKVSSKFSIKGDISWVAYLQGTRSLDLQASNMGGLVNGFDGSTGNMTIGFSYYLGSAAEHSDWTPTFYGDPEALAALKAKVEKAEKDMMDDDKDGVPNYLDEEVDTPEGTVVDTKGRTVKTTKAGDMDEDGVLDVEDYCPTIKGSATANGCPDSDGDGVYDFIDRCPKEKGDAKNGGCPGTNLMDGDGNSAGLRIIEFETGKATLTKRSYPTLDKVAEVLTKNPNYNVEINGHTDNVGTPEFNMQLSKDRAATVKKYLIKKGISESRMTTNGFGDTMPKASNDTEEGKSRNRRVEFIVK